MLAARPRREESAARGPALLRERSTAILPSSERATLCGASNPRSKGPATDCPRRRPPSPRSLPGRSRQPRQSRHGLFSASACSSLSESARAALARPWIRRSRLAILVARSARRLPPRSASRVLLRTRSPLLLTREVHVGAGFIGARGPTIRVRLLARRPRCDEIVVRVALTRRGAVYLFQPSLDAAAFQNTAGAIVQTLRGGGSTRRR